MHLGFRPPRAAAARSAAGPILAALALLAATPARAGEVVRIAVAVGPGPFTVTAPGLTVAPLREGSGAAEAAAGRATFALRGGALTVNGAPLDAAGAALDAAGPLRVDAAPRATFAGGLEVRRAPGGLAVIHAVPLEDYVAAVTVSEMPARFPPAALQAQAVAARTFAVFKKLEAVGEGRPWHLGATVLDQVYRAGEPDPRARAAAAATAGEVLVFEHAPIEAYFHSTCGGRTERGADALGRDRPYLASVACDRCRASPRARWTVRVPAAELGARAGLPGAVASARVAGRTASGRAARVELAGRGRSVTLSAVDLRQRLGFERLPSLDFDVKVAGGAAVFQGRGAGHGAGLCQWGAAGAAEAGEDYRAILARYYPGTEIVRMY
ncbi:SpoIID/LytB domain-containing protein [Anaeromyxobacter diazotrophicus]|uniref:Cell division protein n=1 Tax=Anaeromyxobacter diazotrophicus TaxID=2590199 RepID=A0A7I9VND5_9BACT|nr:SpoIID/LytB domain-containing protein [Anaeromyxobacter diazotrophicus]GEJ57925.1 cell division protein [Anaeromyxobacter diazotrophicus]